MAELTDSQLVSYGNKRSGTEDEAENRESITLTPFKSQAIFKKFLEAGVISLPLRTYEKLGGDEEAARNRTSTQVAKVITDGELRRLDLLPTLLMLFPCPTISQQSAPQSASASRTSRGCHFQNHGAPVRANYHLFVASQPLPQQAILLRGAATVLLQQWILLSDDATLLSRRLFRLERQALKKVRFLEDGKPGYVFLSKTRNADSGLWGIEQEVAEDGHRTSDRVGTSKSRRKRARTRETGDEYEARLACLDKSDQVPGGKQRTRPDESRGKFLDSLGDSLNMVTDSQDDVYRNYEFDYDAIMQRLHDQGDVHENEGFFLENELRKMEQGQIHGAPGPYGGPLHNAVPSFLFPDDERSVLNTSFSDDRPFFNASWKGYTDFRDEKQREKTSTTGETGLPSHEKLRGTRESLRPLQLTLPLSPSKFGRLQTTTSHVHNDEDFVRDDTRNGEFFDLRSGSGREDIEEGKAEAAREGERYREAAAKEKGAYRVFAADETYLSRWGDELEVENDYFAGGPESADAHERNLQQPDSMHGWHPENVRAKERNCDSFHERAPAKANEQRKLELPLFSLEDLPLREDAATEPSPKRLHLRDARAGHGREGTGPDSTHEAGKASRKVLWDRVAFASPGLPSLLISPTLSLSEKQRQWKEFWNHVDSLQAQIEHAQTLALLTIRFHLSSPMLGLLQCDPPLSLLALHTDIPGGSPAANPFSSRRRSKSPTEQSRKHSHESCDGDHAFSRMHRRAIPTKNSTDLSAFPGGAYEPSSTSACQWRCSWEEASRAAIPWFLKQHSVPSFRSFLAEPESDRERTLRNPPVDGSRLTENVVPGEGVSWVDETIDESSFFECRPAARKPPKSAASSSEILSRLGPLSGSREAENALQPCSDGTSSSDYVEILRGLFDSSSLTQGAYTSHDMRAKHGGFTRTRNSSQLLHQYISFRPNAEDLLNPASVSCVSSSGAASLSDRVSDDLFFDFPDKSDQSELANDASSVAARRSSTAASGSEENVTPEHSPRPLGLLTSLAHPGGGPIEDRSKGGLSSIEHAGKEKNLAPTSRAAWTSRSAPAMSSSLSCALSSQSTRDGMGESDDTPRQSERDGRDTATREGFRSFLYALLRRKVLLSRGDLGEEPSGERDSPDFSPSARANCKRLPCLSRGPGTEAREESTSPEKKLIAKLAFHEVVPDGRVRPSTAAKAFLHLLSLHCRGEILLTQAQSVPHTRTHHETLFICGTKEILFEDQSADHSSAGSPPAEKSPEGCATEKQQAHRNADGAQWVVGA